MKKKLEINSLESPTEQSDRAKRMARRKRKREIITIIIIIKEFIKESNCSNDDEEW